MLYMGTQREKNVNCDFILLSSSGGGRSCSACQSVSLRCAACQHCQRLPQVSVKDSQTQQASAAETEPVTLSLAERGSLRAGSLPQHSEDGGSLVGGGSWVGPLRWVPLGQPARGMWSPLPPRNNETPSLVSSG